MFYETWEEFENSADDERYSTDDDEEDADTKSEPEPLPSRLLLLPGEIRSKIYDYVYSGCFVATGRFRIWSTVEIQRQPVRNTDQVQIVEMLKAQYSELDTWLLRRQPGKLPFFTDLNPWQDRLFKQNLPLIIRKERKSRAFRHAANTALLFTCRQIYAEFAMLLYSRAVLAFGSFSTINHMLDAPKPGGGGNGKTVLTKRMAISAYNLPWIRRICIDCHSCGRMVNAGGEFQMFRYYQQWKESSRLIAANLTGLEELDLFIEIPRPLLRSNEVAKLNMDAMWVEAFLPLQKCLALREVAVHLTLNENPGHMVSVDTLEAFAQVLRLTLLNGDKETMSKGFANMYFAWRKEVGEFQAAYDLIVDEQWGTMAAWNGIQLPHDLKHYT